MCGLIKFPPFSAGFYTQQDFVPESELAPFSVNQQENFIEIELKNHYKITFLKTGQISSYLDLRIKNRPRQLVQENKFLNQLAIHEDVPFYWDAWDVMHHTFE